MGCGFVMFFKQRTAYERRISDWSSDVCSSDLDFVISSVNSAKAFHDVTTGQDSIAAAGRDEVIAIDTCTLHIDDKAEAARRLKDLGIVLLDCTVSGNRRACLDGNLPPYASGDEPDYRPAARAPHASPPHHPPAATRRGK